MLFGLLLLLKVWDDHNIILVSWHILVSLFDVGDRHVSHVRIKGCTLRKVLESVKA